MSYSPKNSSVWTVKKAGWLIITLCCLLTACRSPTVQEQDHPALTNSLYNHVDDLLNSGQINRSLSYLDSAYRFFSHPGPIDLWKKYSHLTNFYLNYQFDPAKAGRYTDSMFMVLKGRELTDKAEYAKTLFARGDVLRAEKKYNEAFKNYYDGRLFAQKHLDSCSFSGFTNRLGLMLYAQQQFLKAIPYFKQALEENSHCKITSSFDDRVAFPQATLNNIAFSFELAKEPDSALVYYKRALALIDRSADGFPKENPFMAMARGVIYGNLGGQYARLNDFARAEKYLRESIRINDRPGYAIEDAQTAKVKLAGLYMRINRFKDADLLIRQLQTDLTCRQGKNQTNESMLLSWYQLKRSYYDRTHNVLHAYQYLQRYDALHDSIREITSGLKNDDMEEVFKDTEQQYKLDLLNKDNRLKTFYLLAILVFSLMTVSILLIVWNNLKRSKKNISELTRLNVQIIEQRNRVMGTLTALEQSQADNTRMMQIVAHDLRTPIGGMTSLAALMLDDTDRPADDRMLLELIKTSGRNSLELVNDLLQVHTRVEEMKKEPVDLSLMLHYCIDLLNYKAEAKGQQIQLHAQSFTLSVNREKLWRVASNLIANAIKFSPGGATIHVELKELPGHVLIAVEDYGIGIPDEMKDKIFDILTEAKRPGTAGEQPFGLGLAISKQIVEAHGGRIWFESKPGNGTTFFVELPIAD